MRKLRIYSGTLAIGASLLTLTTPAFAEDAGSPVADSAAPAVTTTPAATAGEAGSSQGGDIVVTAQRRTERLRDVPMSITALNAESLSKAGVGNTLDLAKVAPGVVIPLYGAYSQPSIRGISSGGSGLGDSTSVSVYIDGVYVASQSSILADLPDVQSVQVLKGPQGTLYGQNAAGGAIIIDTIKPSFTWKGKATIGYGNYDNKLARGYITGPITSTLAFALAASYQDRGGFNKDVLRGGHDPGLDSKQVRGKLMWQPNPDMSFTVAGYLVKRSDTGAYARQALNGNSTGVRAIINNHLNIPIPTKPWRIANSKVGAADYRNWGFSLTGRIGVGDAGTINSVTAYVRNAIDNSSDVDGTGDHNGENYTIIKEKHFIQELNFVSNKFGGFSFIAGLFYMHRDSNYAPQLFRLGSNAKAYPTDPNPFTTFIGSHSRSLRKSYAIYLEGNYDITDQLTVTLAGRYSMERVRTFNAPFYTPFVIGQDPLPPMFEDPRGTAKFNKFTPRAVIRYKPNNNHTFYASYSQGFKSGFVNNSRVHACGPYANPPNAQPYPGCLDAPVKPEIVTAYEIGYKGKLSPQVDVSAAIFHYIYKDLQVFIYDPILGSVYQNAGAGRVNGLELEATVRPTSELSFHGAVAYLDAKYSKFPNALIYTPIPLSCPVGGPPPNCTGLGNSSSLLNVKGKHLMRTPKWTATLSANYSHKFVGGELGLYVGASYNSGFSFDPQGRVKQRPFALVDAEISFAPTSFANGTKVAIWGKNLTKKATFSGALESGGGDNVTYGEPRTWGVRFEYQF